MAVKNSTFRCPRARIGVVCGGERSQARPQSPPATVDRAQPTVTDGHVRRPRDNSSAVSSRTDSVWQCGTRRLTDLYGVITETVRTERRVRMHGTLRGRTEGYRRVYERRLPGKRRRRHTVNLIDDLVVISTPTRRSVGSLRMSLTCRCLTHGFFRPVSLLPAFKLVFRNIAVLFDINTNYELQRLCVNAAG